MFRDPYQGHIKSHKVSNRLLCNKHHAYIWQIKIPLCLDMATRSSDENKSHKEQNWEHSIRSKNELENHNKSKLHKHFMSSASDTTTIMVTRTSRKRSGRWEIDNYQRSTKNFPYKPNFHIRRLREPQFLKQSSFEIKLMEPLSYSRTYWTLYLCACRPVWHKTYSYAVDFFKRR